MLRAPLTWLMCAGLAVWVSPSRSGAQQYITDDAGITEFRACQLQVWHGERSSWALPVCTPVRNLEASVGLIAVWEDEGKGHVEYAAQLKTVLIPRTRRSWGLGLVVGTGRDPGLSGSRRPGWSTYTYLPLTVSVLDERLLLHGNVGYLYDHRTGDDNDRQSLTTASRADFSIRKYLAVVGEIYDSTGSDAEFQVGVRTWARPDVVQLDLSYGGFLTRMERAAGWTLGVALTIRPFL